MLLECIEIQRLVHRGDDPQPMTERKKKRERQERGKAN
jgi:hypothetical protein